MIPYPTEKRMWVLLHTSSGHWDNGDCNETLYWSEREAWLAIPPGTVGVWKPIEVTVRPVKKRR